MRGPGPARRGRALGSVRPVKRRLARLLERLGLVRVAGALWSELEYGRARLRARGAQPEAGDGLPVPPPRLIYLVSHTADSAWYLAGGERAAGSVAGILERNGTSIEERADVLDFGCGCGRVIRRFCGLDARLTGTDVNAAATAWCAANLPFA